MDKKKLIDVTKYKSNGKVPSGESTKKTTQSSGERLKLAKTTLIIDEDDNEMTISEWHQSLEDGESIQVHCPISPESHSNGDASPSCTMKRNGDYLNLKCFGCDQSAYYTTVKSKVPKRSKGEFEYSVPSFDKEEALKQVRKNLDNLEDIVVEIIRFLPALEKKIKEEK